MTYFRIGKSSFLGNWFRSNEMHAMASTQITANVAVSSNVVRHLNSDKKKI